MTIFNTTFRAKFKTKFNVNPVVAVMLSMMLSMILPGTLWADNAQLKGTIRDNQGVNLPAVTIIVKETGTATITDLNGKFSLPVPGDQKQVTLILEREGFHPRERRVTIDNNEKILQILFIPQEYLLQKVTVTAMSEEKELVSVPMAETSVTALEIIERVPESVVESLSETAGVHFIGSGGLSITPSIRGMARRRVLVLVDGHRITSDRRAGTSPTFVPPELAQGIEVVRSASSVLYGSDAMGGVINILTRGSDHIGKTDVEKNALNLNYNSANQRINSGITFNKKMGHWTLYSGFQYSKADDYDTPNQTILHSGHTYYSGLFDISYNHDGRHFYLGYIGGVGKDIGKPDRENNPDQYTVVPREDNHFIRLGYNDKHLIKNSVFDISMFLNPNTYNLEKIKRADDKVEGSDTEAMNMGLKASLKRNIAKNLSYKMGLEWFSRTGVRMDNHVRTGDLLERSTPMADGLRNDYGMFFIMDYSGSPTLDINGGIRYTFFGTSASAGGNILKKTGSSPSIFLGVLKKITPSMSVFVNIGRAFRFPSLGESFYSGLTGRRYVIGNPDLDAESSWNIDTGLKLGTPKFSMGLYLFANTINHMIERYRNDDNVYTYANIDQGRVQGGEVEFRYKPVGNIDIYGHYYHYIGRSRTDDTPLNDLPAPRLLLGGEIFLGQLRLGCNYHYSFKKSDPGPAEILNNAFDCLDINGGYYFSSGLFLYLKVSNLGNRFYYPNPDPDIPAARGLHVAGGLHYYF